jgi:hypothetical protein
MYNEKIICNTKRTEHSIIKPTTCFYPIGHHQVHQEYEYVTLYIHEKVRHHSMVCPQVVDGGPTSNMDGSCGYIQSAVSGLLT